MPDLMKRPLTVFLKDMHNKPFERTRCDHGTFPVVSVARAAQGQR